MVHTKLQIYSAQMSHTFEPSRFAVTANFYSLCLPPWNSGEHMTCSGWWVAPLAEIIGSHPQHEKRVAYLTKTRWTNWYLFVKSFIFYYLCYYRLLLKLENRTVVWMKNLNKLLCSSWSSLCYYVKILTDVASLLVNGWVFDILKTKPTLCFDILPSICHHSVTVRQRW